MEKHKIQPFPIEYRQIFDEKLAQFFLLQKLQISDMEQIELKIRHSKHSLKRAAQRSIDSKTIMQALTYGTPYYRQGMTFYTVLDKDLPKDINHRVREKLHNLVVVLGDKGEQIVTCYYNNAPVRYIRRKQKELVKYKRV